MERPRDRGGFPRLCVLVRWRILRRALFRHFVDHDWVAWGHVGGPGWWCRFRRCRRLWLDTFIGRTAFGKTGHSPVDPIVLYWFRGLPCH